MRQVAIVARKRIAALDLTEKEFAARWHTLAETRGHRVKFRTVIFELSRLLAGEERGFRFFFLKVRTATTATALEWTIDQLLAEIGILDSGGRDGVALPAGGAS